MTGCRAVEHIGLQHGVGGDSSQLDTVVSQYVHIVFEVLTHFGDRFALQQRLEFLKRPVEIDLSRRSHVVVPEWQVSGFARFTTERETYQLRLHVVQASSLCIDGEGASRCQSLYPGFKLSLLQ